MYHFFSGTGFSDRFRQGTRSDKTEVGFLFVPTIMRRYA